VWYPVAEKYYAKKKGARDGNLGLFEFRGDFFEGSLEYFQACVEDFMCYDQWWGEAYRALT
jgi:hypothetical protein